MWLVMLWLVLCILRMKLERGELARESYAGAMQKRAHLSSSFCAMGKIFIIGTGDMETLKHRGSGR